MTNLKEAKARIKINKMLEQAGWQFFDHTDNLANIQLELNTKITQKDVDAFGADFESTKSGFVDFLLLDDRGFPLVVMEANEKRKIRWMVRASTPLCTITQCSFCYPFKR